MVEYYEELPAGMGFPTADDMRQWQLLFEKAVPGGNSAELIGFKFADGHLFGVCRGKGGSNRRPDLGHWPRQR